MNANALVQDLVRARLDGEVVARDRTDYDRFRRVWNAMADRRPAVVARARSVSDVEKIVRVAAEHDSLLAVRGGGHSIPGLSTCDDGIMLDLSMMNAVQVDRAAAQAVAQGGALLGDLDRTGVPQGLVVPAGVVSHTGVGGLTLGGGMGWLSRRYGLTIDSLMAVEIVTADGQARHISADRDAELFWAIRGGGGNFGVVTNFTFRMHPLGPVLVGRWTYSFAEARSALRRLGDLAAEAPRELTCGFILVPTGLTVVACWSGAPDRAQEAVAPFGSLGRPETEFLGDLTFLELQTLSDERLAWNRRYYAKGGFFRELDDTAIFCMIDCVTDAPSEEAEVYVIQLGGAVSDIDEDATAYNGRAAGFYWIAESAWDRAEDDEAMVAWNKMAGGRLAEISMRGNYVNEQGEVGKEIAQAAYGERKYSRLAKLKARYDPGNLFRLNQNIEPRT